MLLKKTLDCQTLRSALVNNMHVPCLKPYTCGEPFSRLLFLVRGSYAVFHWSVPAARGATDQPHILPLDQIKPGMTGVAYTIFAGDKIEPFDIEVIGILPEPNKGQSSPLSWSSCTEKKAEHTGVVAGKSGSPVNLDGKIAGALSLKFGVFVKEPRGGVTPIEDVLSIPTDESPSNPKTLSVRSTVADNYWNPPLPPRVGLPPWHRQ